MKSASLHSGTRPLNRLVWWLCFAWATYLMSISFQAFRVFTLEPTWRNGGLWGGAVLLLMQAILLLIYDSYVHERSQNHIQKPIRLFEWMIQKRFLLRDVLQHKEMTE